MIKSLCGFFSADFLNFDLLSVDFFRTLMSEFLHSKLKKVYIMKFYLHKWNFFDRSKTYLFSFFMGKSMKSDDYDSSGFHYDAASKTFKNLIN